MKKKKKVGWLIALIVVGLIVAAVVFSGVVDPGNMVLGNNTNVCGYAKGKVHSQKFETVEDALQAATEEQNFDIGMTTVIYQSRTGNLEKVYLLGQDEIDGYEFLLHEDGTYTYSGVRRAMFVNDFQTEKYDWQTTVLSDLCISTSKSYKRFVNPRKNYGVLPAWGVADTDIVKDMTVDGQPVDEVIEFSQNEKVYYLWMIDDLKTENNAVDVKVEVLN